MNILNQIVSYKKQEVETRKLLVPLPELLKSSFFGRPCLSLKSSLMDNSKTGIIAEFKRKSPSKGFINRDADVKDVTEAYTKFGASGLSVLTDNHFFGGSTADLVTARQNEIPILRKDFIIDQYQLFVSKAIGADVVLLIAACLSRTKLKRLAGYAKDLGLEVLLEIHEERELDHICDGIDIIGINNRNLKTFEVDIDRSIALSRRLPENMLKIAESGIRDADAVRKFRLEGYNGFLMGETFMKEKDPGQSFGNFVNSL